MASDAEPGTAAVATPAIVPQESPASVDPSDLGSDALVAWSGAGVDGHGSVPDATGPVVASAPDSLTEELTAEAAHSSPYDQFAAFDATWHEAAIDVPEPPEPAPSPDDRASLGDVGEVSGPPAAVTAEDRTTDSASTGPAWLMDDSEVSPAAEMEPVSAHADLDDASGLAEPREADADTTDATSTLHADEGSWADVSIMMSADSIMAAEVEDEEPLQSAAAGHLADDALSVDGWPEPLLAEYAPYVPTPVIATPAIPASPPDETLAERDGDAVDAPDKAVALHNDAASDMAEGGVEDSASPTGPIAAWGSPGVGADPAPTHETHIAAALDRLAEQVRRGEIDVSSIAPGGPDAAVVAAVLAALLGGGRSSSR
jgi:hypothetical protein